MAELHKNIQNFKKKKKLGKEIIILFRRRKKTTFFCLLKVQFKFMHLLQGNALIRVGTDDIKAYQYVKYKSQLCGE